MLRKEKLSDDQLKHLEEELSQTNEEIEKLRKVFFSAEWQRASMTERTDLYTSFPWRKTYPKHDLGDYIGELQGRKSRYEDVIQNGGEIIVSTYGSFSSVEKKVYIYLGNVKKSAPEHRNGKAVLTKPLITTFIHEMLHAWNYFACGQRDRTIREIDEAMVEFATLYFLEQITQVHSEFKPILEWAEYNIRNKQTTIGCIAAYGYGYYLFSKYLKDERQVLELFTSYSKNSGLIQPSSSARYIETMLYPSYPYNREEEVYKKIQKLLRPSYKVTRKEEIQTRIEEILKSHESVFNGLIDGHRVVVTLISVH